MRRASEVLREIRARHTSADSALTDPALSAKDTPACVRDAVVFLRDTPIAEVRQDFWRECRNESRKRGEPRQPLVSDPIVRRFARYERGPSGIPATYLRRLLSDTADLWAMAPNLQPLYLRKYPSRSIPGINWPWFGDPRFLSVTGDGMGLLKVRVLDTDAGGPCRFRLLEFDDPELEEFVNSTAVPECVRAGRRVEPRPTGFHYRPLFNSSIRARKLDGDLDLRQFRDVLDMVFQPLSYWVDYAAPSPRPGVSP